MASAGIYVGTSGWTYDDWNGPFYPEGVRGSERLAYYALRFDTVEVNATFYRLPTEAMINAWNQRLKAPFQLVLKGSRFVTHRKKLVDCREALQLFYDRVERLERLQVVLWQLPPSLHRDLERLEAFLRQLPQTWRHALEFRHSSWWDDATAELLRVFQVAMVAVSHPRLPDTILPTTDFLYLRFHGLGEQLYRYDYSEDELQQWVDRVTPFMANRRVYAFFNNDYEAHAPRNALRFRELLAHAT